ncbi:MAG: cell division protein FtsA, partial [Clostridia bacterium]|nr:cell division protein FtsA [Clostridia bacterium]
VQNVLRAVQRAGVDVEGVFFAPLAAAEAVLHADERDLGVFLVDIGGGTTDVIHFHQGSLAHAEVIPLGGEYITTDIAVGLRTSLAQAEILKVDHGWASPRFVEGNETVPVPGVDGQRVRDVPVRVLAEVIEARLQEILLGAARVVEDCGGPGRAPGGLVLTGGVAATRGIADLAEAIVDMPVRVGQPDPLPGLREVVAPAASTAVGLLVLDAAAGRLRSRSEDGRPVSVFRRLGRWLQEWF